MEIMPVEIVVSGAEDGIVVSGQKEPVGVQVDPQKKGRVIHETYVLNDKAALKKKLSNETSRKEAFNAGTDARDGSNVVILMKTSFFEHVKSSFIEDLVKMNAISSIENAVGTKVQTGNSGDAFVEYALDISFKVEENIHAVKFTAYATTCKIMIQPLGDKSKTFIHLDNKTVPRYFVDFFLLPWCAKAFANKKYDEKALMDAITNEIVRLDLLKVSTKKARGRLTSVPSNDAKCAARTCKFTGLNLNNKLAVGVCAKCGYFEHFECSKTKQEDRVLILKGEQKYFCSICFSKNPAMVAFDGNKKAIQLTPTTKATPIAIETSVVYKCEVCNFVTKDQDTFDKHNKYVNTIVCETCKETMHSKTDLERHIKSHHTRPCITCDLEFKTISELKDHMKTSHGPQCTLCNKSFDKPEDLEKHIAEKHNNKAQAQAIKHVCNVCQESFLFMTNILIS